MPLAVVYWMMNFKIHSEIRVMVLITYKRRNLMNLFIYRVLAKKIDVKRKSFYIIICSFFSGKTEQMLWRTNTRIYSIRA